MTGTISTDKRVPAPIALSGGRQLSFERPLVMGIVNVTPDSFSDGGQFLLADHAVGHALRLVEEGADLIDIGGESSRPGADAISIEDEIQRVLPVIEQLRSQTEIPISIDTYKAAVAEKAILAGADIINDISALRTDAEMVRIAAQTGAPVVLMHMLGTPLTMQQNPCYDNCVEEILAFLAQRIAFATQHGVVRGKLIVDPGIGFGKRVQDNLELLAHVERFSHFGLPVLVGASRKSFIDKVAGTGASPAERLGGSIAAALVALLHGANIVRVHDVAATIEALRVAKAVVDKR
ncbi:MAG: dihydropteroate synthase [candidate division Zixibacteria bacterium]|nr:dihydropteroate synthase [candidate division Zixibacteria bacterium]